MSFQQIAIYIGVVILIILLIIIAINMNSAVKTSKWPPVIGDCPDYWYDAGSGGSKCTVNVDNVNRGNFEGGEVNFSRAPYTSNRGECAKYRWATENTVSWDGITYGRENPCITVSKNIQK